LEYSRLGSLNEWFAELLICPKWEGYVVSFHLGKSMQENYLQPIDAMPPCNIYKQSTFFCSFAFFLEAFIGITF
jgi:hypothetical protein